MSLLHSDYDIEAKKIGFKDEINPECKEELLERIYQIPWHKFLGIQVEELMLGRARIRLPYRADFVGNDKLGLHGGVLASLVDICAVATMWSFCQPFDKTATVDLKVDYLRPALHQDMIAQGEMRMLGNRLSNISVYMWGANDPEKIVAEARAVFYTSHK